MSHFAKSLYIRSVLAPVTVMLFAAGFRPSTKIFDALVNPISPPIDKTVVAKTRGGVRRIISTALKGKALMRDRTFIGFNCEELYLAKNQFNSNR